MITADPAATASCEISLEASGRAGARFGCSLCSGAGAFDGDGAFAAAAVDSGLHRWEAGARRNLARRIERRIERGSRF